MRNKARVDGQIRQFERVDLKIVNLLNSVGMHVPNVLVSSISHHDIGGFYTLTDEGAVLDGADEVRTVKLEPCALTTMAA